jgi:hypothetical protein
MWLWISHSSLLMCLWRLAKFAMRFLPNKLPSNCSALSPQGSRRNQSGRRHLACGPFWYADNACSRLLRAT